MSRLLREHGATREGELLDLLRLRIAPALAAGATAALVEEPPLLVAGAILLVGGYAEHGLYPRHLMPLARILLRALVPIVALLVVWAVGRALGVDLSPHTMLACAAVAWVFLALGAWVRVRFEHDRPVRIALIGPVELVDALAAEIAAAGIRGYELVGWIAAGDGEDLTDPRRLGSLGSVGAIVRSHNVDLLLHSAGDRGEAVSRLEVFATVADQCLELPVRMMEFDAFYEELLGHVPIGRINSAWFQYILHPRFHPGSPLAHRVADVIVAVALVPFVLPLVALGALVVKLGDRGPAFYRQRRVGEGGREFEIVKLRTMRVGAQAGGPQWSSQSDPRVTRVGRVMRGLHLDELPQLWNVLRGEMTFVGPRPEQPPIVLELERAFPYYERRHLVKPGITGWAQVRCGYAGTERGAAFKLCHDLYYLKRRSRFFDAMICVETLRATGGFSPAATTPAEELILGLPDARQPGPP